jgi:hypothetical protein
MPQSRARASARTRAPRESEGRRPHRRIARIRPRFRRGGGGFVEPAEALPLGEHHVVDLEVDAGKKRVHDAVVQVTGPHVLDLVGVELARHRRQSLLRLALQRRYHRGRKHRLRHGPCAVRAHPRRTAAPCGRDAGDGARHQHRVGLVHDLRQHPRPHQPARHQASPRIPSKRGRYFNTDERDFVAVYSR